MSRDGMGQGGVTNHLGEVFSSNDSAVYQGLICCDGSVVPSSLGKLFNPGSPQYPLTVQASIHLQLLLPSLSGLYPCLRRSTVFRSTSQRKMARSMLTASQGSQSPYQFPTRKRRVQVGSSLKSLLDTSASILEARAASSCNTKARLPHES